MKWRLLAVLWRWMHVLVYLIMLLYPCAAAAGCDKAQFRCRNGQCIRLDLYCDGHVDCTDHSDELAHCTVCNRTYYGNEGVSYQLELRQPRRDSLPFTCHLTFIGDGGRHGDLLQLTFDTFSVGRFTSHVTDGCPDGHMTIEEPARGLSSGQWCGAGWGHNVYYSEHSSVHVRFVITRLAESIGFAAEEASHFYVKMHYKFVSMQRSVMRNGRKNSKFRGIPVHNSFCDFMFDNCDRDRCRIQSANFPGMYPRNITCSYHITHTNVPRGQRALLELSQPRSELVNIKDSDAAAGRRRRLQIGAKCDLVRDHVTVYDGVTKSSPKLLRFCGSGPLPAVVSSGSNIIVEFRASAFDRLSQATYAADQRRLLHAAHTPGFELEVRVRFVNISEERSQLTTDGNCSYTFASTVAISGYIHSPRHSLPSNTQCIYKLLGRGHERLWLYFVEYHVDYHPGHETQRDAAVRSRHCHHRLDIIDGSPDEIHNRSLGFFCGDNKPLLCARAWKTWRHAAAVSPCRRPQESYLSTGENVTLIHRHVSGLVLDRVRFLARYEFVDMREDGQQWGQRPCHRLFNSAGRLSRGTFGPAKNVFLYGRGGAEQLRCVFRFEGSESERVRVVVNRYSAADIRGCESVYDRRLKRYQCRYHGNTRSRLMMADVMWQEVRVWRDCVCSDRVGSSTQFHLESSGNVMELQYEVFNMTPSEDHHSYSFMAMYEFVRHDGCSRQKHFNGSSGDIELSVSSSSEDGCNQVPWMVTASPGASLYVSVSGRHFSPGQCPSDVRLVISSPDQEDPVAVVCPGVDDTVDVFSSGWVFGDSQQNYKTSNHLNKNYVTANESRGLDRLILQLVNAQPGETVKVSWLELVHPEIYRDEAGPVKVFSSFGSPAARQSPCVHMCAELHGGCIAPHLWCDHVQHCPSGRDEDPEICHRWRVPWLYIGVGCAAIVIILALSVATLTRRRHPHAATSTANNAATSLTGRRSKQLSTNETLATGTMNSNSSWSVRNAKDLMSARSTFSVASEQDLVETTV